MSYHKHVRQLKTHRNVLYGIVVLLLLLQIVSFLVTGSQVSKILLKQDSISNNLGELKDEIEQARQDAQFGINSLADEIVTQRTDIENQINLLKTEQADFSAVIDKAIPGVGSIITDKASGSGFIISDDGYVITNYHVINGANIIKVQTYDGSRRDAVLIGYDGFIDLALLKIEGSFNSLKLADSDNVQIGEKVIAIGNPLGLQFTVTEGIVSGLKRVGPNGLAAYIQTDVTLNPGNSGGPLINKEGDVIGINNFKLGGAEGLGFALESKVAKEYINLIANFQLV